LVKCIIFDLDGVLVLSRDLHYHSLNAALASIAPELCISRDEHLAVYDGLPTSKKLKILTENRGLDETLHGTIWKLKQEKTIAIIKEHLTQNMQITNILKHLYNDGLIICVASNSIRETTKIFLLYSNLMEFVHYFVSNEDVKNPKPNPEMYLKCMIKFGLSPHECVIVEDSHIGRKAAKESGAYLCAVKNPNDVSYDTISNMVASINKEHSANFSSIKWKGNTMNILIPMAGAGKRFAQAGYTFAKPLIEIHGKPMIQLVVENLNIEGNYTFIVRKEHYEKYNLKYLLNLIANGCNIIQVDSTTEGAACTTLLAKDIINNNENLLIANADQYVEWDSNQFMYSMIADNIDGGILTFKSAHPKWSFAKTDDNGYVIEVAEKKPISDNATVGIYFWSKGSDYVKYAEQMIKKDKRVNGEFYVCPVFNEAIADNKKIKTYHIDEMWGLGTPEDVSTFLNRKGTDIE